MFEQRRSMTALLSASHSQCCMHYQEHQSGQPIACLLQVNTSVDNIGARRLHTVLERIVEDISFDAPEKVNRTPC